MANRTAFLLSFFMLILTSISNTIFATHNRAGEITYVHVFGNTYDFTITTCTKSSSPADRDELEIFWGDGTSAFLPRTNVENIPNYDAQKNYYEGRHTYTGAGTYIVQFEDPNRNEGILNINNSVLTPFCVRTTLYISPFLGPDNSIKIDGCPCPEFACFNKRWCYNVKAYDIDGDSLSYQLVPSRGEGCVEMLVPSQYAYPNNVGGGDLQIDPLTGTVCWDSPQVIGEYNFAVLIFSYRQGQLISSVLHDLQVTVINCNNDPPEITIPNDTCVFVGDSLSIDVSAFDPDNDRVDLIATGEPFNMSSNPATFNSNAPIINPQGLFTWKTDCSHARPGTYQVVFEAVDDNTVVSLSDIKVLRIKIVAPPPQNLTVQPQGGTMILNWDTHPCENTSFYRIYRSTNDFLPLDDCCENFDPFSQGFSLVGTSTSSNYVDNGNLIIGNQYCYFITAVLENGTESCPSQSDCNELRQEVPIITHVTVVETSNDSGSDSIIWAPPKDLQTSLFPGPYEYRVYRGEGFTGSNEVLVHTTPQELILEDVDTIFFDTDNLNTSGIPYYYKIELYSEGVLVGNSNKASSVYLSATPNDNQIDLTWEFQVPWTNYLYEIYREDPTGSGNFVQIATTENTSYTDTNLINQTPYCYKVLAIGEYTAPGIVTPLLNWSQVVCEEPWDFTAPCPPQIDYTDFCEDGIIEFIWNNPNNDCADDVTRYALYYTEVEGEEFEVLATFSSDEDTTFAYTNELSIAGCYYITATDSIPYNNESNPSNVVCIDNCPLYELPNVITPDGNNINDIFHPIFPYRNISDIDLQVFNRWGKLVFSTTDPDINWNGTNQENGEPLSDGVYYYVCAINTIRLSGIVTETIQGNIYIMSE